MSIYKPKKANVSHFLGIDYGESKVGLATADSETRMAFQYATLDNDNNFLQKLSEIIQKENISKVIIGISASVEVKPLRFRLENFLKEKLKMKIEYQEEMFTTKQAQRNLIEKGVKGIKKFDDQEAARIILQGWLDKKK
jgi:putative Holliday junction resolvase